MNNNKNNDFKEFCVYRYLLKGTQTVVYVGKTNSSLRARVTAHKYEKKFQEFGPYDVEYISLSNKVETDCIEKFLINAWKPILNQKDKVDGLTQDISIENLSWIPYSYYNGVSLTEKQRSNLIDKCNEKMEFLKLAVCASMNEESKGMFIAPKFYSETAISLLDGTYQIVNPYVETTNMGYIYHVRPDTKEKLIKTASQIAASIWLPAFRVCKMNDDQELQYLLLTEEMDFAERIDDFAKNGYEDENSLYQYEMVFDKISNHAIETYIRVFSGYPSMNTARCSVEIDRFGYEENMLSCKEHTASKLLSFAASLGLTNIIMPNYEQRICKNSSPYQEKVLDKTTCYDLLRGNYYSYLQSDYVL